MIALAAAAVMMLAQAGDYDAPGVHNGPQTYYVFKDGKQVTDQPVSWRSCKKRIINIPGLACVSLPPQEPERR